MLPSGGSLVVPLLSPGFHSKIDTSICLVVYGVPLHLMRHGVSYNVFDCVQRARIYMVVVYFVS